MRCVRVRIRRAPLLLPELSDWFRMAEFRERMGSEGESALLGVIQLRNGAFRAVAESFAHDI